MHLSIHHLQKLKINITHRKNISINPIIAILYQPVIQQSRDASTGIFPLSLII